MADAIVLPDWCAADEAVRWLSGQDPDYRRSLQQAKAPAVRRLAVALAHYAYIQRNKKDYLHMSHHAR